MLVERWSTLIAPNDLMSFRSGDSWLVTNPGLASWILMSDWEYEVLIRRMHQWPSNRVVPALVARFDESESLARLRLEKLLARCVLRWILYLPENVPEVGNPQPQLRTVYYAITEGCNLRCPYCYASAVRPRSDELSTDESLQLVDEIAALGAQELIFTGGEPMLRRDLFDVAARSRRQGLRTNIITNGTVIKTSEIAQQMAEIFDVVTVSIDGGSAAVHERTRGRGTFRVVRRALQLLNDAGVAPKINHVVGPNNVDHLEETLGFLSHFRISQFRMLNHGPLGRGLQDGQDLDWLDYLKTHRFAATHSAALRVLTDGPRLPQPGTVRGNCGLGGSEIYVDSRGNVYPCKLITTMRQCAGNLRAQSLRQLYAEPALAELRDVSVERLGACASCYVRGVCGGGCRAFHAGYSGDLRRNSETFCQTLRHMVVTQMWLASGLLPDRLLDERGPAYRPTLVKASAPDLGRLKEN